ncbi:MAG TPA: GNAT family N-acetyltransferase, partial [Bacteroidales bacterium]|nr:GNAT family N-acetyltransferase [Bacteroidales bacterium]
MIRYLKNYEINRRKWDECIEQAYNGNVYAWSWYLDLTCDGWDALVEGNYRNVFPVTRKQKLGFCYLAQPLFSQQLGLFSSGMPDADTINRFLIELFKRFSFAEICLNSYNLPDKNQFHVTQRQNLELDVILSYEQLEAGYSANTIRNLRKARRNGVTAGNPVAPELVAEMFRNNKGKHLTGLNHGYYQTLLKIIYSALERKSAEVIGAYTSQNELCAGAFLLRSHRRIVLIFSAYTKLALENGAMFLLIDHVIRRYAGQPLTFDFEGSDIPGLARFYAGFGSKANAYPQVFHNNLPIPYKYLLRCYKLVRQSVFSFRSWL